MNEFEQKSVPKEDILRKKIFQSKMTIFGWKNLFQYANEYLKKLKKIPEIAFAMAHHPGTF